MVSVSEKRVMLVKAFLSQKLPANSPLVNEIIARASKNGPLTPEKFADSWIETEMRLLASLRTLEMNHKAFRTQLSATNAESSQDLDPILERKLEFLEDKILIETRANLLDNIRWNEDAQAETKEDLKRLNLNFPQISSDFGNESLNQVEKPRGIVLKVVAVIYTFCALAAGLIQCSFLDLSAGSMLTFSIFSGQNFPKKIEIFAAGAAAAAFVLELLRTPAESLEKSLLFLRTGLCVSRLAMIGAVVVWLVWPGFKAKGSKTSV